MKVIYSRKVVYYTPTFPVNKRRSTGTDGVRSGFVRDIKVVDNLQLVAVYIFELDETYSK